MSRVLAKDRIGQQIGDLTILKLTRKNKYGQWFCNVKCSCGNEVEKLLDSITRDKKNTKSCGCKRKKHSNSAFWQIYTSYQYGAKKRGFYFNLSESEFNTLIEQDCHYCGSKPSMTREAYGDKVVYNGIDRIDNTIGYDVKNTVPCCTECNFAKGNMTYFDFLSLIRRIFLWQNR